ncbi:MAG: potassium-transporting ATPase subunit KdpC [Rubrobacter sp.]
MEARQNTGGSAASLLRPVLLSTVLFTLVCGLAYPLLATGVAQLVFPSQADGSLIERDGQTVGSELLGQQFTQPQYFRPRPSATVATDGSGEAVPYNAAQSAGTNYGSTNEALISATRENAITYREENNLPNEAPVPVDAVTTSGSGLDPHISVANAALQVPRVAEARGISEAEARRLIEENTDGRLFGLIGEPGVNVLRLNLALDDQE